ncbi:hypothetical protein KSP40_PGU009563 [Platanthera guangdongensis]|uniref:Helicase Helix-turn-helix domain-containing protein n=1 Tax=Platanthera guangdongensis TaxID=2320717 RepID=A0ABR2MC18_9ASPA
MLLAARPRAFVYLPPLAFTPVFPSETEKLLRWRTPGSLPSVAIYGGVRSLAGRPPPSQTETWSSHRQHAARRDVQDFLPSTCHHAFYKRFFPAFAPDLGKICKGSASATPSCSFSDKGVSTAQQPPHDPVTAPLQQFGYGSIQERCHDTSPWQFQPWSSLLKPHLVNSYGDKFLQTISNASQELGLLLNEESNTVTSAKKDNLSSLKKLSPARFEAWKVWQIFKKTLTEISTLGRSVPLKEQTIISYILEAAHTGYEVDWARFCSEIGLTLEIFSQIHSTVSKIGSRERLKPIKEELPENVSFFEGFFFPVIL